MKNRDWENIFGRAPESFLGQVEATLDGLKAEKHMKKRYSVSAVLIAAALVVLLTGAALAAGQGLIDRINQTDDYRLNEPAEQLISRNLGSMENEFFTVVIEEAVYDGQSTMMQVLLTLREPEKYALYHADYPMPAELEENFIYEAQDGQDSRLPTACRDGRTVLLYDVSVSQVRGDEMGGNGADDLMAPQYNEDGSVRLLIGGTADIPIRKDTIYFAVTCRWGIPGEYEYSGYQSIGAPYLPHFEEIRLGIGNADGRAKFALEPAGEPWGGLLEFVGGTIEYTSIGGYYDIEYIYAGEGAWYENDLAWEADGSALHRSYRLYYGESEGGTIRMQGMIERTEEIPEMLTLILTERMQETELGRIALKVTEAEEEAPQD